MNKIHHLEGPQNLNDFIAHASSWQKFSFYTGWQHVSLVKGVDKEVQKLAQIPEISINPHFPVEKRDLYNRIYGADQKISQLQANLPENQDTLKIATGQLNCLVRRIYQLVQAILFCLFKKIIHPSVNLKEMMHKFPLSTTWHHGDLRITGKLLRFSQIGGFDPLALTGEIHITVKGKTDHGTEMALWQHKNQLYAKFDSVVDDELAIAVDIGKEIMDKENISSMHLQCQDSRTIQALKKAGFKNSGTPHVWSNMTPKTNLQYLAGYQPKYFALQDVGVFQGKRVTAEAGMDISLKPSGVTIKVGHEILCLGRDSPSRIDLSIPNEASYFRPELFQIAAEILKADETATEIRYWPTGPKSAKEAYMSGFHYHLEELNVNMQKGLPPMVSEMIFKKENISSYEKAITEYPILKNPGSLLPA